MTNDLFIDAFNKIKERGPTKMLEHVKNVNGLRNFCKPHLIEIEPHKTRRDSGIC